jgi:peptidoglycan/xylan/chitin deacetylase (PgdA/CDA1 family)
MRSPCKRGAGRGVDESTVHRRRINLTFHGIGDHARALEAGETDVWVTRERFVEVLDEVAGSGDDVRVTFDDGNLSDLRLALPELRARGLRGSFFVIAGKVGTPEFLGVEDLRALADAGMTVGAHGMHHLRWSETGEDELRDEVETARRALEDATGLPITQVAIPFGAYNRRVLRALVRTGYERVYTSDRGTAQPTAWLQARNTVTESSGPLERILSYDNLSWRMRRVAKRWR